MTVWWISDPDRLAQERASIDAFDENWFEHAEWSLDGEARLRLIFDVVLPRGRFRLAMIYHNTFPASPPSVRPLNEDTRLSDHQFGAGGDLCLQIRADNWDLTRTGADMVRSAHNLLEMETPREDGERVVAPSEHDFPYELALRSSVTRFYLDPQTLLMLMHDKHDAAELKIGLDYRNGKFSVARILKLVAPDGTTALLGTPEGLQKTSWELSGHLYKIDTPSSTVLSVNTVDALSELVGERFQHGRDAHWACVIRSSDDCVYLITHLSDGNDVRVYHTIVSPFDKRRSGLEHNALANKRVGIVGLGSLGSKIATSLARAGVGRFELVDGDILHAGNIERHDGDWRDVGRHKADVAAHRLELVHSRISSHPWRTYIGAQVSSEEAGNVSAALDACDVLIDATANPDVFNNLAFIAMRSNHTLVWGAVYAGGVGGEIARSRPDKDPSPYAIRQVLTQIYETSEEEPPMAGDGGYEGASGDDEPMIATDAAVSVFAAHMAEFAVDALLELEPSPYGAPAFLIGLRRAWLFDGPFDTRPVEVDAPPRAKLSPTQKTPIDSDFLKSLFKTLGNETQNTEADD